MCPSRRITPASKQTHPRTLLDISFPLPRAPLRPLLRSPPTRPSPPPPSPPFHFDGLMVLRGAVGLTVLSWCEPNPSGTQYPVYQLSALWKTTTIPSRGRSSELITVCSGHSQGRSLLRYSAAVSSESRLCCLFFFFFFLFSFPESIHVFVSCSVSKSPGSHISKQPLCWSAR